LKSLKINDKKLVNHGVYLKEFLDKFEKLKKENNFHNFT